MIQFNIPLKAYNTFHIEERARYFVEVRTMAQLESLRGHEIYSENKWFVLGGGSNILFTRPPENPVVKVSIPGVSVSPAPDNTVFVTVGGGVVWHDLVIWSLENGYFGLENLSLIPGQMGAAPIQNIGAYGVELTDVFDHLTAFEIETGICHTFTHSDCQFGYRNSVFKQELKGRFVIVSVTLRLHKEPRLNLDYGDIRNVLSERGIQSPTPVDVSKAVISIRQSKLPDPDQLGNAGSFFKNPEIDPEYFQKLKTNFPELPGYPVFGDRVKVPAGWLIDRLGWKGRQNGQAAVHYRQALVLVNLGAAKGSEIRDLAMQVKASVFETYGIDLEPEVNII